MMFSIQNIINNIFDITRILKTNKYIIFFYLIINILTKFPLYTKMKYVKNHTKK